MVTVVIKQLTTIFLLSAASLSIAGPDASPKTAVLAEGPRDASASELGVGRLLPDVTIKPVSVKSFGLSQAKPKGALVIAFTSKSCPVASRYAPTLAAIEKQVEPEGVKFIFVDPVETDSEADAKQAVRTHGFRGPYVRDAGGQVAGALGARTTTEVFVLDAARTLVYRGAVDDQYGLGYSLDAPHRTYLLDVLRAVGTNGTATTRATTAPGCALASAGSRRASEALTYHARISRILHAHCNECHHADGAAPFSLQTYREVVSHAGMMRKQVERGAMPPTYAPAQPAGGHRWANDRTLPAQDKADLIAWLQGSHFEGDAAQAPLPRKFARVWEIGVPDAIVRLPNPIAVKATGKMPYEN